MQYTNYFGLISRHQGQLNLPPSEFQRMMNIVHLEGVIFGLSRAKESYADTNLYHRYDVIILKYDTQLSELTGSVPPDVLLQEMVQGEE
jgi:hypothetical protein